MQFYDEVEGYTGKGIARLIVAIGVLILVYILFALVFSFWPFSVAAGLAKAVVNETSIISNYQWFYDQYNAIQSQRANLEALVKDAPERTGLKMVLNSMIGEYNSRSKQITRNLWKAKDLPYQIEFGGER